MEISCRKAKSLPLNYFDALLVRLIAIGQNESFARTEVFHAYLDGKPSARNKKALSRSARDELFWASCVVSECPVDQWRNEAMVLALTRYLGQEDVSAAKILEKIARSVPDAVIRAVRHSRLVSSPHSVRRKEVDQAAKLSKEIAEVCRVLDTFDGAHRMRVVELDKCKAFFADITPFELLAYASLYAFEQLIPHCLSANLSVGSNGVRVDVAWDAINDLLIWKLSDAEPGALKLDDENIVRSLRKHIIPLLFPEGPKFGRPESMLIQFRALMEAQIELNEFRSRSMDAFSYDESIRFERRDQVLNIVESNSAVSETWLRDVRKIERLHGYWFYRAFDAFAKSDAAKKSFGRPENQDDNRLAYIRAMRTYLRLREVYGIADQVSAETCEPVDLFQSLLSLELMSMFFMREFLAEFAAMASASGDWIVALQTLALNGLGNDPQIRWPLTWSDRTSKVANITGWTVSEAEPQGSAHMASAILDFWTYDVAAIAGRLQGSEMSLSPRLFERPILKFGSMLVQLPWVVGIQNSSTAAINNIRRLGARRDRAREETRRIEIGLARMLQSRGFRVLTNWFPPDMARDAGEVDVIAMRDGHLFILEVKSTFLRQSLRDAWLHSTTTLRKAGRQLARKVAAVLPALETDDSLREALEYSSMLPPSHVHGWIVDTSIECDHQRFAGFLKISLEEMLIALRDERRLLHEPDGLLSGASNFDVDIKESGRERCDTLYPDGFSAERFVEVIEAEAVWTAI
jgi:Holliday junction resolvase-like predicted endonuclease